MKAVNIYSGETKNNKKHPECVRRKVSILKMSDNSSDEDEYSVGAFN